MNGLIRSVSLLWVHYLSNLNIFEFTHCFFSLCAFFVQILCVVGVVVSLYAYYVETKAEADDGYEAMCDLSETISCTKVFTSEYGKGFGLIQMVVGDDSPLVQPNSVYGLIFYTTVFLLGLAGQNDLCFYFAVVSCLGSIYLACILVFVLQDTCIVCISMYIINILMLWVTHNGRSVKVLYFVSPILFSLKFILRLNSKILICNVTFPDLLMNWHVGFSVFVRHT